MFATFKQIFSSKNKDIRLKILFTLLVLFIFKLGTTITVPGTESLTKDLGFLDLWSAMSGGYWRSVIRGTSLFILFTISVKKIRIYLNKNTDNHIIIKKERKWLLC